MVFLYNMRYLILLGELQVVVGLQQLRVLSELRDGDRRVVHHTCAPIRGRKQKEKVRKTKKDT